MKEKDHYLKTFHLFSKQMKFCSVTKCFVNHNILLVMQGFVCVCVFKPCAVLKCLYLIWLPFIPDRKTRAESS